MAPSFIQFHYLPSGLVIPDLEYLKDFSFVMDLGANPSTSSTLTTDRNRIWSAVGNDGKITIAYTDRFNVNGGVGQTNKFITSIDGGLNWSAPTALLPTVGGQVVVDAVAATDGWVYVVTCKRLSSVEIFAISPEGSVARIHYWNYQSLYHQPFNGKMLVQPNGDVHFFVPPNFLSNWASFRMKAGQLLQSSYAVQLGIGSNYSELSAFCVAIAPGGFLPLGEIMAIGPSPSSTGSYYVRAVRSRDGGFTWENLGNVSHTWLQPSNPLGLFVNPDGTRNIVWKAKDGAIFWNRFDGDGWLHPLTRTWGVSDNNAPHRLSAIPGTFSGANGTRSIDIHTARDRFLAFIDGFQGNTFGSVLQQELKVRFFGHDGTPTAQELIPLTSSGDDLRNRLTGINGDNGVVSLDGQITLPFGGSSGQASFSDASYITKVSNNFFLKGNDQGFGAMLIPLIQNAVAGKAHSVVTSPDRRHIFVLWMAAHDGDVWAQDPTYSLLRRLYSTYYAAP